MSASTTPRPLPNTGARSGLLEALAFFRDPPFAQGRFERFGAVFETRLLGQPLVFIRGGKAMAELEIRLLAVGLLGRLELRLEPNQDLSMQLVPSPSPRGGLLVRVASAGPWSEGSEQGSPGGGPR